MPLRLVALGGLSALLCAQTPADEPVKVQVKASRPKAEVQRLEETTPQVTVRRETFEKRPDAKAADLVKRLPGVAIGGPGGKARDIRLRGLDKEFTRIQVDGIALPGPGEKREFNLDLLPSFLVEEIRILRNPTADVEADGIAGRVDIKTRPIPREGFGNLRALAGEQDATGRRAFELSGGWGKRLNDRFGLSVALSSQRSAIDFTKTKTTPTQVETEVNLEQPWTRSLMVDLAFYGNRGEWHVKPLWLREDNDKTKEKTVAAPGKALVPSEESEGRVTETQGLQLDGRWLLGPAWTLDARLGTYRTDEDKDKLAREWKALGTPISKAQRDLEDKFDRTHQGQADLTWTPEGHVAKTGIFWRERDRERDKQSFNTLTNAMLVISDPNYHLEERTLAGYAQDDWSLSPSFTLTPGLRLESVRITSRVPGAEATRTETDALPRLHALWRVRDDLSLRAAVSRVLNRPQFDQLSPWEQVKKDKVVIGNPDLKPARATAWDLGGEWSKGRFFFGANLYHRQVSGVLEEVDSGERRNGLPVYRVQNVGDGWTRGLELEQRVRLHERMELWANQALMDSELEDSSGNRRPFKEQPRRIYNLGVDLNWHRITLVVAGRHVGDRVEVKATGETKTLEAATAVDAALRMKLWKGLEAFLEVENLGAPDRVERERLVSGPTRSVETAQRDARFGLQWRF
jgi:outer membrane receptor protein involved in Fe transport